MRGATTECWFTSRHQKKDTAVDARSQQAFDILPAILACTRSVLTRDVFDEHKIVSAIAEVQYLAQRLLLWESGDQTPDHRHCKSGPTPSAQLRQPNRWHTQATWAAGLELDMPRAAIRTAAEPRRPCPTRTSTTARRCVGARSRSARLPVGCSAWAVAVTESAAPVSAGSTAVAARSAVDEHRRELPAQPDLITGGSLGQVTPRWRSQYTCLAHQCCPQSEILWPKLQYPVVWAVMRLASHLA